MLRFTSEHKTLDQVDFEHRVTLNYLLYALEEYKIFRRRLEEILVANIHLDIIEEYNEQKDNLESIEDKALKLIKFVKQLQDLIEENELKKSAINETMNLEKHHIIMKEYDKYLDYYQNIRDKYLDFVAFWN